LLQWLSLRPEGAGNTWIVIHCTSDHPRALSSAVACWSWVEKLDNCGVHLKLIGSLILSKYIGEAGSNQLSRVRWDNASLMRTLKRLVQRASAIRTQDADFEMLLTDYEDATSVQDCLIRYSDGSITRLLRISRMAVDVMLDRVARKRKDRQIGSKDYLLTIGDFNGANERLTNK
jgi:hypothetical protein